MDAASVELHHFKNKLKVESMTDKNVIEINICDKQIQHILLA